MNGTTIEDKIVLVTGANRGLGRALVDEALARAATRVYAGTRQPLVHPDKRVIALTLDVTEPEQVAKAVQSVDALDVLINNAGISLPDGLTERSAFDEHLAVNLYGTWSVTEAFLPRLTEVRGAIVNVVSLAAFAAVPVLPAYSVSKAALFSLTQSIRALAARDGVSVHAVVGGPIDTDMVRQLDVPKTAPESVAVGIFDGLARGDEEIFPDPFAEPMAEGWRSSPLKAFERQNAQLLQQVAEAA